ncbi:MlaE family ABC transporter permease [Tautonia plasticadhaerens]|uniref:ABC transport permease subunit MlaE n=1 Tax=Tautonia plasticadhaerens TaxID=2527974 RepID=A0A518H2R0_9BACT|nr:ABC transporter permease [Tautonia plasticadhaerens]QDV35125.1 ABC transport permease subunit MlaE [Tautonia plasticadhaerens]
MDATAAPDASASASPGPPTARPADSAPTPDARAEGPNPGPPPRPPEDSPVRKLGEQFFDAVAEVGNLAVFSGLTLMWLVRRRPRWSTLVPNFYVIGVKSMPVVAVTGTFIGMVLAVQAHRQFEAMGMETRLGSVINISLVKELGPVLAATMLAGRVGSAMAAELGTMRVTEQVDALDVLGANPIAYLAVPRLLACVLLIPLLTLMADFMGIIGGAVVSTQMLGVDSYHYWAHSRAFVGGLDIFAGVFKSYFFGAAIALISCHRGFNCSAGAEGVGKAATEAFVTSFVAILFLDFCLGLMWNKLYVAIWPNSGTLI